ncbi:GNAT family N-acetyltransferase [Aestuariivirga sp.]|jgi:predicted N-acyltransferase|uniref:GNAT family N-acetyltransferase n=1 Tax=Aestuariivirga sp. TaxID=2650926 RepID=UPI00378426DD
MLRTVSSILDISRDDWNRLANPSGQEFNPLVSHDFFRCLEASQCASNTSGWTPRHVSSTDSSGQLIGIAPCYLKHHSYGEYVFDHAWADAITRAGGRYYPKLQVSVPFTPVTGPRLLASTDQDRSMLATGLVELCKTENCSSVHITFLPETDWLLLTGPAWLPRTDIQFHWHNQTYASFQDFLDSLTSAKRKNIRKERQSISESGITMRLLTGRDIKEHHWDAFYSFYMDTGTRKWGTPYLNRLFFSLIGEAMADHILLVMAERSGRMIAGALNFIGSHALYGRNWGAIEYHDNLHFETCYYQAIDFAIAHRLDRVEAGAQGPHKLARGYMPAKTYSLHHLAHPGLQRAVANYLELERRGIDQEQHALAAHAPFRQEQDN